ncbi:MAG: CO dehydrogenase/acetyl-CoA synthase complex subunit epsilon, partial [Methanoregula sp.]|nr:CO dehydrogenase/acetyl-CoA synthase complex subunit epsilon [Methanoregula sp.]
MTTIEPWQTAEIAGPKRASVITKPEIADAMIQRAKHPVLVIGHLASEIDLDDRKMLDYLLLLAQRGHIPIIATAHTNRELLKRGYKKAGIMSAVDIGQRLCDPAWKGLDGKESYDLAIFAGLPYYMEWTILSGLKHFAPHVKTMTLDNTYQPHANWSFSNLSVKD